MNKYFFFKKIRQLSSLKRLNAAFMSLIFLIFCNTSFAQFSGIYAPANWSIVHVNGGNGSVNAGGAPVSIALTGPDNAAGACYTRYEITMLSSGNVSFNWSVNHGDPYYDDFGYYKNGTYTILTSATGSGSTSVPVLAGDVFAFYGYTHDGCCGTFTATISNFVGPALPPPTIVSFTPPNGCSENTSFTITGTNFTGATAVTIGGTNVQSFVVNNATTITAVVGTGTTGNIVVTTPDGIATSASVFTVKQSPTVSITATLDPVCDGDSTVLTASAINMGGGGTYMFFPGPVPGNVLTVAPLVNTVYTVIAIAANACSHTSTKLISVSQLSSPPTSVLATPQVVCSGGTSNLKSIATAGSTQYWYSDSVGGTLLGSSISGVNFPVTPLITTTYYVETQELTPPGNYTFSYTGGMQSFVVPNGVDSITVDVIGAKGGKGHNPYSNGGDGGRVQAKIPVVAGETLQIYVGGQGGDGSAVAGGVGGYNGGGTGALYSGSYAGGGGGGASDIRR
ncbi:MAG: Ig family protein, partial [Bacteroidetes bacterium OLB11]